jgi:hypothetical protein
MNTVLRNVRFVVVAIIALLMGYGSSLLVASASEPPPPPEWINFDGTLNAEKLPACFHIVGENGQKVLDNEGIPVCISSDLLFAPPPAPSENHSEDRHSVSSEEQEANIDVLQPVNLLDLLQK